MKSKNLITERIEKLVEMVANEQSRNLEKLGIFKTNPLLKKTDKFQIFYQSRLHTFYDRRVPFNEFKEKCTPIFSFRSLSKNKTQVYSVHIIDVSGLYNTIGYIVMYTVADARSGNINSSIDGNEYKFISYRKGSPIAKAFDGWNE